MQGMLSFDFKTHWYDLFMHYLLACNQLHLFMQQFFSFLKQPSTNQLGQVSPRSHCGRSLPRVLQTTNDVIRNSTKMSPLRELSICKMV